ncbi:flgN protein [Eubacterium sp. CAG:786]|nr:flgN protein [Eubacterium sp. CAG:786]
MDERTAQAVIKCLEIDCDFYRELHKFLMKKHTKILDDDLEWLTDSLNTEQAYVMKSQSLEKKRQALFQGLGIADRKLSEMMDEVPEGCRAKMKQLSMQLADLVDNIREINEQTNEIVKRKLDNQAELVRRAGIFNKPETYNKSASKVTGGSSAKAFREV